MPYDQNLISAIRIRSPRPVQSLQDEKTVEVRLRSRGPIVRALDIDENADVESLVKSLRQKNGGLPLVAIVFASRLRDPGSSTRFIESLRSSFDLRSDAIWAVELSCRENGPRHGDGLSVVLDGGNSDDLSLLRNLVADILFFPAQDEKESERLRDFARRAPFVILANSGPRHAELEGTATSVELGTVLYDVESNTVRPPDPIAAPDPPLLGERLRVTAVRLTVRRDRRSQFRRKLLSLRPQLHDDWDREIVEAADSHHWPEWAMQMLPARYVPVTTSGEAITAYAWTSIAECFTPQASIVRRLCRGEMVEVVLPSDVARFLDELSLEIEDCIDQAPNGEQAFNGAILGAISAKMDDLPKGREEWRLKMQRFLDQLVVQLGA